MATSPDEETDPMSNRYIPREARAVPHEEVVHTIEFRKITYPLTDRPAELWIVETNHRGHKHWRTLERFLDDFAISPLGAPPDYAMASCAHLETLALQWREYYSVPHPFPHGGPPQLQELRRHVLPQQIVTPIPPLKAHTHSQSTTTTSSLLGTVRISPLSRQSCFEFICSLFSASTTSTTHNNFGDFHTTYDFGPDLQTPMAGPCSHLFLRLHR